MRHSFTPVSHTATEPGRSVNSRLFTQDLAGVERHHPDKVVDTARHDVDAARLDQVGSVTASPSMRMVDPAGSRTSRTARPAAAGRRSSEKPPPA